MKSIIRAFVVVLALTGAAASAHQTARTETSGARLSIAKISSFPVPTCPPDDPHACGMGQSDLQ